MSNTSEVTAQLEATANNGLAEIAKMKREHDEKIAKLQAELKKAQAEQKALNKVQKPFKVDRFKASDKGWLSVYFTVGRFPVNMNLEQVKALLDGAVIEQLREFVAQEEGKGLLTYLQRKGMGTETE